MERRSIRSRAPDLAARQYLLSVARRHQPRAILVADLRGNVVAGVEGRPFMETGFVATRASQRVEHVLISEALAALPSEVEEPMTGKPWARLVARPRAALRRTVFRVRALLARRGRPDWMAATSRWVARFEVGGEKLMIVCVGDGGSALAAGPETAAGLQRILTPI